MKRISFIGALICAILLLAVTAFGYPNPAATIPQDNTSVSVTKDMSPPNSMGTLTANNTAMFSGTAPPVFSYNTDTAATTTIADNTLTTATTFQATQYSDITATFATTAFLHAEYASPPPSKDVTTTSTALPTSGYLNTGPTTSTLSNGQAITTMAQRIQPTNTEGAMGISPTIVVNDYPNPFNATMTNNGASRSAPTNTVAVTMAKKTMSTSDVLRC